MHTFGSMPRQEVGSPRSARTIEYFPQLSERPVARSLSLARITDTLAGTTRPGYSVRPSIPAGYQVHDPTPAAARGADKPPALAAIVCPSWQEPNAGVVWD